MKYSNCDICLSPLHGADLCDLCDKPMYRIIRMFREHPERNRTIKRGLTLRQARAHCSDPETSSSTATSRMGRSRTRNCGPWFDGYDLDTGRR